MLDKHTLFKLVVKYAACKGPEVDSNEAPICLIPIFGLQPLKNAQNPSITEHPNR
jgi:hypothetical protein